MPPNYNTIIDSYLSWIKDNTQLKLISDKNIAEITTPFMDRHNDHLQIYVMRSPSGGYILTDDGYVLHDLETTGFELNTQKRDKIFKTILNGLGVKLGDKHDLFVEANSSNIGQKKHNLLQAIMAVNDLHTLSQENVYSLFKEDVETFFRSKEIFYTKDIKITGKTGFDHNIDFLITATKTQPERLIRTINNPKKDAVFNAIFAFNDIQANREEKASNFVIYNDEENPISGDVHGALSSYQISELPWSKRNEFVSQLQAN